MTSRQILSNATSGESLEFPLPDKSLTLRLVIVGTSTTPISAFIDMPCINKKLILGLEGINGGGAYVKLQRKFNNENSSFEDSGDFWYEDDTRCHYF